jgi:hypothetical protein
LALDRTQQAGTKAWLTAWINATYDMSNFAMMRRNLSEWRQFIPLTKKADYLYSGSGAVVQLPGVTTLPSTTCTQ